MRRRRGGVLRGLVELLCLVVAIAGLGLFVGLARGAEPIPEKLTAQACIELQVKRQAHGFALGDKLPAGELLCFACDGYAPAAWVESPQRMHLVRLVELRRS